MTDLRQRLAEFFPFRRVQVGCRFELDAETLGEGLHQRLLDRLPVGQFAEQVLQVGHALARRGDGLVGQFLRGTRSTRNASRLTQTLLST